MCGICGFIGSGSDTDLRRMTDLLRHRGPDAEGHWHDSTRAVYLGHRRLSIIDLVSGDQPMWTADGRLGIVFNGEIYNHLELRRQLVQLGHRFLTDHSDTEVLLHGYRQWGEPFVSRLNGMWAFALYDVEKGSLFLSRDRFGKKPLFYTLQGDSFVFASELNALIRHPSVRARIDSLSLKKYFAYGFIPAPRTICRDVCKLPAGWNLTVSLADLNVRTGSYWEFVLDPFEKIPKHPEEEWGEEVRRLLKESVRKRLMSDVPLGVFLSGGIDSSSITAFAAEIVGRERIKTFCVGFEEASFDETQYAREVADLFQTEHHQEILSIERGKDLLPVIAGRLDEPMGDSSLLPTYLLCQETRKFVTVALSGDGGDELFAGYDPFCALTSAGLYDALVPKRVHQAVRTLVSLLPTAHRNMSLDFRLKRTLRGLSYDRRLWNAVWLGPLDPSDLFDLFHEPTPLEELYAEAIEQWEACPQDNLVDKTLQFYTKLYLQDDILVKADRASMMNSLEVRAPYLDVDLVDFVRRIPHRYKYRRGCTKYLLKKSLEPVLPNKILYRSKKGFGVPIGKWFAEGRLTVREDGGGIHNASYIRKKVAEHRAGRSDHRMFLWNLWLFDIWRDAFGPQS